MRNWLGQELEVGSVVYRGARLGNGSEFKVGVVTGFKNNKVQVEYKYTHGTLWELVDRGAKYSDGSIRYDRDFVAYVPVKTESKGNPSVDSLVVLDQGELLRLDAIDALSNEWDTRQDTDFPMSKEEFLDRMSRF